MASIPRRPRFTHGVTDLTLTWSCKPWIPARSTVGSRNVSAAGIPAAYIVRDDDLLDLVLRFEEWEWPLVLALIDFGLTSQSFRWYPDADETDTEYESFEVYLESPAPGERFAPTRSDHPLIFEASITLRGVGLEVPFRDYFVED